jgi:hypothetical protein
MGKRVSSVTKNGGVFDRIFRMDWMGKMNADHAEGKICHREIRELRVVERDLARE